jgi:hypothetical protein
LELHFSASNRRKAFAVVWFGAFSECVMTVLGQKFVLDYGILNGKKWDIACRGMATTTKV